MAAKNYSKTLSDAKVMASGIRKNEAALQKRGVTKETADEIEAQIADVESLNNEQESLKARLKEATDKLNKEVKALNSMTASTAKIVKIELPQTLWIEFGITAKQ